ncbi:MAG: hypothetical protein CSA18_02230 [Deltaproteobacteria bacterium]|nr:MAG: hypothetical protein CSB21_01235 [Deltaproteobacteria bacterium]PIE74950.1 MAG: hypothetical protein CSA18_02230 [Deltaproteobacteria bacterium]
MARIKVTKYKGCSNKDIAKAILSLSNNIIKACGGDETLVRLVLSIAVAAWNISLYPEKENDYSQKVMEKIPESLPLEYKELLKTFFLKFIDEKQKRFPGFKKGITSYKLKFENSMPQLVVHALPVKPE